MAAVSSRWSTALVLLAGLGLTISFTLIPPERALGVAFVPARDDVVLEKVPPRVRAAAAGALTQAEAAARAKELISQSRANGGDPRLLGQAQAVLSKWWADPQASSELVLMRATVKQSLHDFEGALADLDLVTAAEPKNPQAWLTRATVLTVLGRYQDAFASCQRMPEREGHLLIPTVAYQVCQVAPIALLGELDTARQSLGVVEVRPEDIANRAWVASVRGELERWAGDDARAEAFLREALTLDPADSYTRLLLAELLLDTKRPGEVAPLYAGRALNDAELLMVVLARPDDVEKRDELAARVAANRQRGETLHRREESRYALRVEGDAEKALALAVENWKVQREPADARVLLEAAVAAHRSVAAEPVMQWLAQTKLPWPVLRKLVEQLP